MRPSQFPIREHYDVMAELDRDVHDDVRLSMTEVDLAAQLIGRVPERVLLPCCGTGRHIPRLLEKGVCKIVGVDLSPACLAKARELVGGDVRVSLIEADLGWWETGEQFDAVILLGNSFGDFVEPEALMEMTIGMTRPLKFGGMMVMDYIGEGYLNRLGVSTTWDSVLHGQPVKDRRTPRYDPETRIMTIDVKVERAATGIRLWEGAYQKLVLNDGEVRDHFLRSGVEIIPRGRATKLNRAYYDHHTGELGMIARSTWWVGIKR